jgi:hypothetical protein
MPHGLGGIVAVLHTYANPAVPAAVVRYSGTDDGSWRYESGAWRMQAVTGSDGTVFVVEEPRGATYAAQLAVLNGETGAVIARHSLPLWSIITDTSASPDVINPVGFVVDANGHARFILKSGYSRISSLDGGSVSHALDLYNVAPDGTVSTTQLDSLTHAPFSSYYYLRPESITPDGDGVLALFVRAEGTGQDEQWNGKYFGATNSSFTLPGPWLPTVTSIDGYGIGRGPESTDPLVSRSLRTGSLRWQSSVQGDAVVALDGGGAGVVSGSASLAILDETGAIAEVDALNVASVPYVYGRFHVRDGSNALKAVPWKPVDDSTAYRRWNLGDSISSPFYYGVAIKSHYVLILGGWEHVALRIVPRNQRAWTAVPNVYHSYFAKNQKIGGDLYYMTIGGGPSIDFPPCSGYLNMGFNRYRDFNAPHIHSRLLPIDPSGEDGAISTLLHTAELFPNNTLVYECFPDEQAGSFNSNSFLRGLLEAAGFGGIPYYLPPWAWLVDLEGWIRPVPSTYFSQQ